MTNTTETAKTAVVCRCGCERVIGAKSFYAQGHDAKHISKLVPMINSAIVDLSPKAAQAVVNSLFDQLPSDALRAKLGRAFDNQKAGKGEHAGWYNTAGDNGIHIPFSSNPSLGATGFFSATKPAPKMDPEPIVPTEVKVGRWYYPLVEAMNTGEGQILVTYTAKDGSTKEATVDVSKLR